MRIVRISEAKKSLSKLVEAAARGEHIGISRLGKIEAILLPPQPQLSLQEIFGGVESIRKRARKRRAVCAKRLLSEGRI